MLVTATVSRQKADEALAKHGIANVENEEVVEKFDTDKIGENDEMVFISHIIDSKSSHGKIELDLDFIISDRATEILTSFLYFVRREEITIIGW